MHANQNYTHNKPSLEIIESNPTSCNNKTHYYLRKGLYPRRKEEKHMAWGAMVVKQRVCE